MEFGKDKLLPITDSDESFSDITFVAPYSPDKDEQTGQLQLDQLLKEIKDNVWGCDLILCLFISALNSYRSDRCLRPFPPSYVNEEGKNFTGLRSTCDSIPPLTTILNEPNKCSHDVKKLLMWLFLERGHPTLRRISYANVPFPGKISNVFRPQFVFEVCYHDKYESVWLKRQDGRETMFAYHGSAVDNFYSILKVGLQQHFSIEKEVLFGNGIYLSNELSVSAHYAPFGQTWTNSCLGSKHSVIAICEVINDVDKVRCRDTKNKRRSLNEDSLGEIPEKYFVVTDSDMVRVKYLMIYRKKRVFSVKSYIAQHLFLCLLLLYFFLIVAIRVFSNSGYVRYLKKFYQLLSFD
ncbi:protein mono-ADP-ribosyltransferase PARP16 [Tribolium castaneum]|uniref:Mono [ADP-ribose] polymerase PARP16-like Protein n=1 Tax=Tribolium castaneum TaxID=7070 RepID=D6W7L9_TRICA|nr:PREDICTED: mono [ADP-ribose] polymerase PARP16 [Tribolium castaneum]EFA11311.2 Mono [ADP-ribose] polymerase PARP16-like Protein [Tribolium castaneum]|eukprot:XP_008199398.1 PREDICTED: mono [ADP-ribose] polymerase PARP16 [Tribolium castaneum]